MLNKGTNIEGTLVQVLCNQPRHWDNQHELEIAFAQSFFRLSFLKSIKQSKFFRIFCLLATWAIRDEWRRQASQKCLTSNWQLSKNLRASRLASRSWTRKPDFSGNNLVGKEEINQRSFSQNLHRPVQIFGPDLLCLLISTELYSRYSKTVRLFCW